MAATKKSIDQQSLALRSAEEIKAAAEKLEDVVDAVRDALVQEISAEDYRQVILKDESLCRAVLGAIYGGTSKAQAKPSKAPGTRKPRVSVPLEQKQEVAAKLAKVATKSKAKETRTVGELRKAAKLDGLDDAIFASCWSWAKDTKNPDATLEWDSNSNERGNGVAWLAK